jgi:transcriptional regulator with XRE-family HTH domain
VSETFGDIGNLAGLSSGLVLQLWREEAGMSAAELARRLDVSRGSVTNWERHSRAMERDTFERLLGLYGIAGEGLLDLISAIDLPGAVDARTTWYHNFPGKGPVWAWLRQPTAAVVAAKAVWGVLTSEVKVPPGSEGVVVTLPLSVPNPPVRLELAEPGWVCFGRGKLPARLPLKMVNPIGSIDVLETADDIRAIFADRLDRLLGRNGSWRAALRRFVAHRADLLDKAFPAPTAAQVQDLTNLALPVHPSADGSVLPASRWQAVRTARRHTQASAADYASALGPEGTRISDDQIQEFEKGAATTVADLAIRLDVVYGLDGHSGLYSQRKWIAGPNAEKVGFPTWWKGPVWIRTAPSASPAAGIIGITWGSWTRLQTIRSGHALTTRTAGGGEAMSIKAPVGWGVTVGLGADPAAIDINARWLAVDNAEADQLFRNYAPSYIALFGRSRQQFTSFVRAIRAGGRSSRL